MIELPFWMQAVGALGVPVVALLGALVAFISYLQRRSADNRAEWWRRVQFGVELARENDRVGRNAGLELLTALIGPDKRVEPADAEMLRQISGTLVQELVDQWIPTETPTTPATRRRRRRRTRMSRPHEGISDDHHDPAE